MKRSKKQKTRDKKKMIMSVVNHQPNAVSEHPEAKGWREFMENDPKGYAEYIKDIDTLTGMK